MSYKDVTEGNHLAKIVRVQMIETPEKHTQGIDVTFTLSEFGNPTMSWTGWLTEKTMERTYKTLSEVLGWNGSTEIKDGVFTDKKAFAYERPVSLKIQEESYESNGETKTKMVVAFVNAVGGGSKFIGLTPEKAQPVLNKLKAMYLSKQQPPAFDDKEEVPF